MHFCKRTQNKKIQAPTGGWFFFAGLPFLGSVKVIPLHQLLPRRKPAFVSKRKTKKHKRCQALGFLCRTSPNGINESNPSFTAKKNRNVSYSCIVLKLQSVRSYCHCRRQIKHNIIIDIPEYDLIGDPEKVDVLKSDQ